MARFRLYGVFACIVGCNYAQKCGGKKLYDEEGSRRRDDAESKIAHETTDALTLSGHARTPSGCKSGDINRTIIEKVRLTRSNARARYIYIYMRYLNI
jgi:hypothetical protein